MKRILVCCVLVAAVLNTAAYLGQANADPPPGTPGGVFVTGHDPDFHATAPGENNAGAINIIRKSVDYVTYNTASPSMLLVSSRQSPPFGHSDSLAGIQAAGYSPAVASAQTGADDAPIDLATVSFGAYDVVVVASDFGGILRQADLDVLNARSADLLSYVNGGGGIVAFAESNTGSQQTPGGGQFDWLPFLVSEVATNQTEANYTVTPFGASLGITPADVNGNFSHNQFTDVGQLQVVDTDEDGNIISAATRGAILCPNGTPVASIGDVSKAEGNSGTTAFSFPVTLDRAPCVPFTVSYSVTLSGSADTNDLIVASGTVTFNPGETSKTITVLVKGDTTNEPDETFFVDITTSSPGGVGDGRGQGTILNDDPKVRGGAFACRGSGLRVIALDPVVANNPFNPCTDAAASLLTAGVAVPSTGGLINVAAKAINASTDQNPNSLAGTTPAATDYGKAVSNVEQATVGLLALVGIDARTLHSEAKVACVAGLPKLTSSSNIATVKVNSTTLTGDGYAKVNLPLSLGTVEVNRTVTTATTITQQAVYVKILGIEIVVAEAKAGFSGNPCVLV